MAVRAVYTAPAKVVCEPGGLGPLDQSLELFQVLPIRWFWGPKIHGNPMLYDPVTIKNLIEDMQRAPAINHVILGDDLEPTHNRFLSENMPIVRHAKTYPNSKIGESVERICWHVIFPRKKRAGTLNPDPLGLNCVSSAAAWVDHPWIYHPLVVSIHRSRNRPCPCNRSCQHASCRRRPAPYSRSAPYKHALEVCLCPSSCPCRHYLACSRLGFRHRFGSSSVPEASRWCLLTGPPALLQPTSPSLNYSSFCSFCELILDPGTATLVLGRSPHPLLGRIKANCRKSSPGWRKSRCFAPDECHFLAIRCGIGQESYNRGKNVRLDLDFGPQPQLDRAATNLMRVPPDFS